jgi:hypothetical protein
MAGWRIKPLNVAYLEAGPHENSIIIFSTQLTNTKLRRRGKQSINSERLQHLHSKGRKHGHTAESILDSFHSCAA